MHETNRYKTYQDITREDRTWVFSGIVGGATISHFCIASEYLRPAIGNGNCNGKKKITLTVHRGHVALN